MGHHLPWELQASGHAAGRQAITASCRRVICVYVCVRNEHLVSHGVHRVCEEFLVGKRWVNAKQEVASHLTRTSRTEENSTTPNDDSGKQGRRARKKCQRKQLKDARQGCPFRVRTARQLTDADRTGKQLKDVGCTAVGRAQGISGGAATGRGGPQGGRDPVAPLKSALSIAP